MKYLVAVSGGIDSVVLLDQLVKQATHELIVAHFDHGIRSDSADDARFVEGLAAQYGLSFVARREALGAQASEQQARLRRYAFLHEQAAHYRASIVTAHHGDDVIETIAINLRRGTGWRGLAVLAGKKVVRPLLAMTKNDIWQYATDRRLEWVEDSTNASDDYLRNQLRHAINRQLPAKAKAALLGLWSQQGDVRRAIEAELANYVSPAGEYDRYFVTHVDPIVGIELIRSAVQGQTGQTPTRPQAERALLAVKTARPGTIYELGSGVSLRFNLRQFIVQTP